MLGWGLLACVLHELGHYLVSRGFGGRLGWLELSAVGAGLGMEYPEPLTYGREILVVLAGPWVNLVSGWLCARAGLFLAAGVSFALGAFNLLPILPLDGGRAVWCGAAALLGTERAERLLDWCAGILLGLMAGCGAVLAAGYANFTLLLTTGWLMWMALTRRRGR